MPAGLRLYIDYKNIDKVETQWRCEIHDENLSVAPSSFKIAPGGVRILNNGQTRALQPGIIGTSVELDLYVRTSAHLGFLDQLRQSSESRYAVKLFRESEVVFIGRLATDGIQFEDDADPIATVVATDGIASLQNIKMTDLTERTILDFIQEALTAAVPLSLYGAGPVLRVAMEMYESSMKNFTDNPLSMTTIAGLAFAGKEDKERPWYQVLEDICVAFNLRLIYSAGCYHLTELPLNVNETYSTWEYDKTHALLGTNTFGEDVEIDQVTRAVRAGNSERYLPPLKEVHITLNYELDSFDQSVSWNQDDETEKNLGFRTIETADTKLMIRGVFTTKSFPSFPQETIETYPQHRYVVQLTIRLIHPDEGDIILVKEVILSPTTQYPQSSFWAPNFAPAFGLGSFGEGPPPTDKRVDLLSAIWTCKDNGNPQGLYYEPGSSASMQFIETTLDKLADLSAWDVGDNIEITAQAQLLAVYDPNLNDISGNTQIDFAWSVENFQVIPVDEGPGGPIKFAIKFRAENDTPGMYETLELKTSIGDAVNAVAGLKILNAADEWVYSQIWRPNSDTGNEAALLTHTCKRLLALRKDARRLYQGAVIAYDFDFFKRLFYQGIRWLPTNGQYYSGDDEWSGEVVEIAEDDVSGVNNPPIGIYGPGDEPVLQPAGDPTDFPSPGPPQGPPAPVLPPVLQTDEPIAEGDPLTEIDIINPQGLTIAAGSFVMIFNNQTGQSEIVELTADITPASTTMFIVTTSFTYAFPTGTPIAIAPVEHFEWLTEDFILSGGETFVDCTGPLPNNAVIPAGGIPERVQVYADGLIKRYQTSPALKRDHGIDKGNERITLGKPGLAGEWLRVRYIIPRG